MTPKQRWLAAIRMQPVDRLPFWPKLDAAYPPAQTGTFAGKDNDQIHDWIGSDKHVGIGNCISENRRRTSAEVVRSNGEMTTIYTTPHGTAELVRRFDDGSQSWHPVKHPVESAADIELMIEWFEDCRPEPNPEALEQARKRADTYGHDAVVATTIGESPLMYWVEWLAGIENSHLLLADCPDRVEHLFSAIHEALLRKTEIAADTSPADILYFSENTSTTLISPNQYRRYCAPHITDYARIVADSERPLILHMCGHLRDLLPQLAAIPARAFEAFTSPPLGNTRLIHGRIHCPDKCLVGGTNAVLWTKPANLVIEQIEEDLAALPHHRGIVVTSAGVMTPLCKPETIREVCQWVKQYPAKT